MADSQITLPNGDTVIVNLDRRRLQFDIRDLYQYRFLEGGSDTVIKPGGQYLPNVDDIAYHFQLGWFRVNSVDQTTYVANLSKWTPREDDVTTDENDKYLATRSGYTSESWLAYLDTRNLPYRLDVDEGFRTYGNKTVGIRLYRGIDVSETGEIVSAWYENGELVSDMIPLEVVATYIDSGLSPTTETTVQAIKAPKKGYCIKDLDEGELITLVGYDNEGVPVRGVRLTVHKTNVYAKPSDAQKRVASIQLISPWLSDTEPNKLIMPMNINVASLTMRARVNYTNGSSVEMDVGDELSGKKFMIYGLMHWSPSQVGESLKLQLVYRLSPGEEYSWVEGETIQNLVREPYEIVASEVNPSLSLKVFAWPVWNQSMLAYELNFWLFDLLRQQYWRLPNSVVELDEDSRSFDGTDYTSVQTLTIGVRLGEVDASWNNHRHVQTFQVALLKPGTQSISNWRVRHTTNQTEWFGIDKQAIATFGTGVNTFLNISNGYSDLQEWLHALYYTQIPLYDPLSEVQAPEPTHFILTTRSREYDFTLSAWNNELSIINDLNEGQNLYIRWVRRDSNGELQLGVTGLIVHHQ